MNYCHINVSLATFNLYAYVYTYEKDAWCPYVGNGFSEVHHVGELILSEFGAGLSLLVTSLTWLYSGFPHPPISLLVLQESLLSR